MRVYETRPITAMSEGSDLRELVFSPITATWKRLYIVDRPKPVARNEIITSEQLLQKERFNIDLLKVIVLLLIANVPASSSIPYNGSWGKWAATISDPVEEDLD